MRPARWLHLMSRDSPVFTSAPNFAFELAARRSSDADLAGVDIANVTHIISGAERVHAATLARFADKFARVGLRPEALRPSYGLAEATVYVAARARGESPAVVHFDAEKLSAGIAERCGGVGAHALVNYGTPQAPVVRIIDSDSSIEKPAGAIGEIWVHGDNVAGGYWGNRAETARTFGASLVDPAPGTPEGPWLRTGDLGVISEGQLFIMGRLKDLVIIDGRNHYPDDVEATVSELTAGRVAAFSVNTESSENLVVIAEFTASGHSDDEILREIRAVEARVMAAVSADHGVRVADLVLVSLTAIPTTTSGKVRRSACAELYRQGQFERVC
jgi:acyl-CoA synthetase (AMP-forming)/AMP-acid ligase II